MSEQKKTCAPTQAEAKRFPIILTAQDTFSQADLEDGYIRVKPSVRDEAYSTARGDI